MSKLNQFSSNKILYYPNIEFNSETWLKTTLLFWDEVYRIVPDGYKPNDSAEIYIAKRNGFIKDIVLSEEDIKQAAIEYEGFMNSIEFKPWGIDASLYEVRLHSDKIDDRLKPFFKQFYKSIDNEGFLRIPENIANGYMFYLSNTVGRRRNIPKISDNPDMFSAMSYYDTDGNLDPLQVDFDADSIYTSLIIENMIPADIRSISIEKIIDLHKDFFKSKNSFRDLLNSFIDRISKMEDKEFIKQEIENFKKELKEKQFSKKEILNKFFNDFGSSFLYVGIPTSLPNLVGPVFETTLGAYGLNNLGSGLTICGLAALSNAGNELRKNWKNSKSSYYLELTKVLDSNAYAHYGIIDMSDRMNEFLND